MIDNSSICSSILVCGGWSFILKGNIWFKEIARDIQLHFTLPPALPSRPHPPYVSTKPSLVRYSLCSSLLHASVVPSFQLVSSLSSTSSTSCKFSGCWTWGLAKIAVSSSFVVARWKDEAGSGWWYSGRRWA